MEWIFWPKIPKSFKGWKILPNPNHVEDFQDFLGPQIKSSNLCAMLALSHSRFVWRFCRMPTTFIRRVRSLPSPTAAAAAVAFASLLLLAITFLCIRFNASRTTGNTRRKKGMSVSLVLPISALSRHFAQALCVNEKC